MAKEKEEFVVADRRKFTAEGELKSDAAVEVPEQSAPPTTTPSAPATPAEQRQPEKMPEPPTSAEQAAQHADYQHANKKIDSILEDQGHKRPPQADITFERLIVSLYMQTMAQLGMIREEGTPPQPDIIGARQTIDTIALLGEKTKGNLTERESHMLQNCLFELRMAFLEITNALTTAPPAGAEQGPQKK
jgi:hypothetical protein